MKPKEKNKNLYSGSIYDWIVKNNYTVTRFAKELGVSRAAVHLYVKGGVCPNTVTAMKIRKITGLKFSEIIDCSEADINYWSRWREEYEGQKAVIDLQRL